MDPQHYRPHLLHPQLPPPKGMRTVTGGHHGVSARSETSRPVPLHPKSCTTSGTHPVPAR
ncbi:protein of unknown function [Streptomyces sp. KY75]|nr:protein of unknown function [Streptomyces sp. KY75]